MTTSHKEMPRAKRREAAQGQSGDGVGRDAEGGPLIDPTENVKALMAASLEALAELRQADKEFNTARWMHLKEIADLRADHLKLLRESDLTTAEKTRQVDVLAAAASAAALATAVQALQSTSDRSTETLRNQVAATAQAMAKQTADSATAVQAQTENLFRRTEALLTAVTDRVSTLERTSAAGAGRQSVVDPQITELITSMGKLVSTTASSGGRREGIGNAWGVMLGAVGLVATLLTIGAVMFTRGGNGPAAQTMAPQVIYVPAPQVTPVPSPVTGAK